VSEQEFNMYLYSL